MSTSPEFTCYVHASEAECASAQTWLDANRGELPSVRVLPVVEVRKRKLAGLFTLDAKGKPVAVTRFTPHRELTLKLFDLLSASIRIGIANMCPSESATHFVAVVEAEYARTKALPSPSKAKS